MNGRADTIAHLVVEICRHKFDHAVVIVFHLQACFLKYLHVHLIVTLLFSVVPAGDWKSREY